MSIEWLSVVELITFTLQKIPWIKEHYRDYKKGKNVKAKILEQGSPMIVVLEIGRSIVDDVRLQLGEPLAVISAKRTLECDEFPLFAWAAYEKIRETRRFIRENLEESVPVTLILSGPVSLNFQLGQLLGLHEDIELYQYCKGDYVYVPKITREKPDGDYIGELK